MSDHVIVNLGRSVLLTCVLAVLLFLLDRPIGPLHGSVFVDQVAICETQACPPEAQIIADLPLRVAREIGTDRRYLTVLVSIQDAGGLNDPVVYFPSAPQIVPQARANSEAEQIDAELITTRRPLTLNIPDRGAPMQLTVTWVNQEGLVLFPFVIAEREVARKESFLRGVFIYGMAQVSIVLMVVSFATCIAIYAADRRQRVFLWVALSNLPASVIGLAYLLPLGIGGPADYVTAITFLATHYVYFLFRFMSDLVGFKAPRLNRICLAGILVLGAAAFLGPDPMQLPITAVLGIWAMSWAVGILVVFQSHRESMGTISYLSLFILLSLALAVSAHDWVIYFTDLSLGPSLVGQALPAVMGIATLWLVLRWLLTTMTSLETLNRELDHIIADKSRELEANYKSLAESRTRVALDEERSRIMIELHDGVGGSIVNILSYVEETKERDPVLEAALSDTLRDIGIIMDSISDLEAPLDATLGALRHRYEPLFDRLGLELTWNVGGTPDMHVIPADRKLDFVRFVQEALNNIVKHAQATRISVELGRNRLVIEDNGLGLNATERQVRSGLSSGMGLRNMRHRARQIGTQFDIEDTGHGTRVVLEWVTPVAP